MGRDRPRLPRLAQHSQRLRYDRLLVYRRRTIYSHLSPTEQKEQGAEDKSNKGTALSPNMMLRGSPVRSLASPEARSTRRERIDVSLDSLKYDYLIIGAGAAGCVLASRLSEDGAQVLLVEAGRDTPPESVPEDIADLYPRSYYNTAYMWPKLKARQISRNPTRPTTYPQARVMGGGSSLMGMVALRGIPEDFDSWEDSGADGWSWKAVLPYFRRLEADRDFHGSLHGADGPITIRRHHPRDWPTFCQAVGTTLDDFGYGRIDDMNGDFRDGYGAIPMSNTQAARVSSTSAYLTRAVRNRTNLRISCETTVHGLRFSGRRCVGVTLSCDRETMDVDAHTTVLSAGALHTPLLLQKSGVGSARELTALGIDVIANLPGVGKNLQNHPVVYLATHLQPYSRQSANLRPAWNTQLRFSSGEAGHVSDLQMLVLNKSSWHGLGTSIGGFGVNLLSGSSRGEVSLVGRPGRHRPVIDFRMLSDESDVNRLLRGFELACAVMQNSHVRELRNEVFAAGYSRVVRRLNRPGIVNSGITHALSKLLDGPDSVRRVLLKWGIASGEIGEWRLSDAPWQRSTVRTRSFGTYHPAGTCKMGDGTAPMDVVSTSGAVLGLQDLYVADASIIPCIPRANTFLTVVMIAEKLSDSLRGLRK